jgi:hypothetical protein
LPLSWFPVHVLGFCIVGCCVFPSSQNWLSFLPSEL